MKKDLLTPILKQMISRKTPFILAVVLLTLLLACEKEKTSNNDPFTGPETKPQFNNTSFGVYKGVVIGSTGIIIFRINNGNNIVKAYLTIDNLKDTLSTTQSLSLGQPLVNIKFTGRVSSLNFSANADGSNAKITNLKVQGHDPVAAIVTHENSDRQVLCYQGTFSGDHDGIINFVKVDTVIRSEPVYYIAKINNDTSFIRGQCLAETDSVGRNNTHYMYMYGNPVRTFSGYPAFTNTDVKGSWVSWKATGITRGTFYCKRTY